MCVWLEGVYTKGYSYLDCQPFREGVYMFAPNKQESYCGDYIHISAHSVYAVLTHADGLCSFEYI